MKNNTNTADLKFIKTDADSSLLGRRIAILLHLLKHGASSVNGMLDAGTVSMTGISLTRLLKQMVADDFISVRGHIKQPHIYEINPMLAQAIAQSSQSYIQDEEITA
ncbi:hypothetical protein [Acinetobacter sp. ANC 3813]|uniref:hypothetical protein n=1 Tax=Acinetobacter sp. ANC 3813 TaxID=1977873 RepID=UPI000A359990|nr:hypothetical protein [Acinetobacter sp. ANC 3813]OTG87912.1 hypothetical protein B9T34_16395 [Acinetobacter sp. ANC 3813]